MYTIVLTTSRSLRTTQIETIYENDDNLSSFQFLIPQMLGNLNMNNFNVLLRYVTADNETMYKAVEYADSLFQGMLSVVVPVTRKFTYKQGYVRLSLIFMSKDQTFIDDSGCKCEWSKITSEIISSQITYKNIDFSTSEAYVEITRNQNYVPGNDLLNRLIYQVDSYEKDKVDNIKAYPETSEIQLESKGRPVGEKTKVPCQYPYGIDAGKEWERIDGKDTDNKDLNAEWEKI